jgi:hypothetical protein
MTELGYRPEQHVTPGLRIGARVRCIEGDWFIDAGQCGTVVNTAPSRPGKPGRARVLWDASDGSQQVCMIDTTDLEVIPAEQQEAYVAQPTSMGSFG